MGAILTNEGRQDVLTQYLSARGANHRIGLYTARAVYGVTAVLADITEATFSGYAIGTPTWVSFGIDANGNSDYAAAALTFTHNGGGTANTVIGYFVKDTASGKLLFLEDFGAPVTLNTNGQFVSVKPDMYGGLLAPPL